MRKTTPLLTLALFVVMTGLAADKQSFTISAPLQPAPGQPATGVLDAAQVRALVDLVITNPAQRANRAFMVHTVKYERGKLTPSVQHWYMTDYTRTSPVETLGDLHLAGRYQDPRIFGRHELGIVYLHALEAVPVETVRARLTAMRADFVQTPPAKEDDQRAEIFSNLADLAKADPANAMLSHKPDPANLSGATLTSMWSDVQVELTIAKLIKEGTSGVVALVSSRGVRLTPWNGSFVETGMDALDTLSYGIDVQSKTPAPWQNLKQIISLAFGGQSGSIRQIRFDLTYTAFVAGGTFDPVQAPSDVTATATYSSSGKDTQIGSQTYDNEGRYWYDFSLALPIASYNDLSYNSTANGLTARKITKNNLFATVNIGIPRDTKNTNFLLIPMLLYGIPISGQPLKHHLFAGSVGLKYVNFFVGTRLDAKTFYHDFNKPLTGDNVFRAWRTHLTYGINFQVAAVVKALSGKTK